MKRFFLCLMAASAIVFTLSAQSSTHSAESLNNRMHVADTLRERVLDEVLVLTNRASNTTPVAQTNLKAAEIKQLTVANNLPHVLWMTPSLVATSENGTGAGYSGLRIRGTDANRINVTLNGIPLNNPESQEVYWVNIPDMTSALNTIQIQRGVGTSTNGPGAFGASINMAVSTSEEAFFESGTTVGSYGTFQQNIAAGTGVFGKGLSFDVRYSNMTTDGYLRNGWCDHESLFASFVKRFDKSALRVNYIYGNQHTGITWEGISAEQMEEDPTFNPAGTIKDGVYYDNESDNYRQHHVQAFYTRSLSDNLLLNAGVNYTDGFGYYEQYKQDRTFSSMGLLNQTVEGVTYAETDLIRRKNMSNGFSTAHINLDYLSDRLRVQTGAMYTYYNGDHFATLLWVENNENIQAEFEWVRNNGVKKDGNVFAKAEYTLLDGLNTYLDLQYRHVSHDLTGIDDDDMEDMTQSRTWDFFNPKAGLYYSKGKHTAFASVAVGQREPARADIKDAFKSGANSTIKPEHLTGYEVGYTYDNQKLMVSYVMYYMNYSNQLVPTGKLNDVGYKLMSNAEKSYRAGVEVALGWKPSNAWQFDANATFSRNRVVDHTVWYETYDNSSDWGDAAQLSQHFDEAKLPYSPESMGAFRVSWKPLRNLSLSATEKFVSEQYITNTQNDALKLPAYHSTNVSMTYDFRLLGVTEASLGVHVINLTNQSYACNGWGYEAHFANGDPTYTEVGLYPVAPRNYLAKFTVRF